MWWSGGIGGRSALDYLIKVKEYSFLEAVELLAVMLVNTQANKRMLQEMPHENIEDLSAMRDSQPKEKPMHFVMK